MVNTSPELRVGILICAYNEEKYIGQSIDIIRKAAGSDARILVVDDGSDDRTSEVARQKGVTVLSFKKNRGKANAFFAGLRWFSRQNSTGVVSLDADLTHLGHRDFLDLRKLVASATHDRRVRMFVCANYERGFSEPPHYALSGTRGFTIGAIHHILSSRLKSIGKGYRLEILLNGLFDRKHKEEFQGDFLYAPPFRKITEVQQESQIDDARERIKRAKNVGFWQSSMHTGRLSFLSRKEFRRRKKQ